VSIAVILFVDVSYIIEILNENNLSPDGIAFAQKNEVVIPGDSLSSSDE